MINEQRRFRILDIYFSSNFGLCFLVGCVMSEMPREEKLKITDYSKAARVIHLHLNKYCDKSLPFPAMVADAAREANKEIEFLKEYFIDFLAQGCGTFNHKKAIYEYDHLCISTYENALRYGIKKGWINESQLLRSL